MLPWLCCQYLGSQWDAMHSETCEQCLEQTPSTWTTCKTNYCFHGHRGTISLKKKPNPRSSLTCFFLISNFPYCRCHYWFLPFTPCSAMSCMWRETTSGDMPVSFVGAHFSLLDAMPLISAFLLSVIRVIITAPSPSRIPLRRLEEGFEMIPVPLECWF